MIHFLDLLLFLIFWGIFLGNFWKFSKCIMIFTVKDKFHEKKRFCDNFCEFLFAIQDIVKSFQNQLISLYVSKLLSILNEIWNAAKFERPEKTANFACPKTLFAGLIRNQSESLGIIRNLWNVWNLVPKNRVIYPSGCMRKKHT